MVYVISDAGAAGRSATTPAPADEVAVAVRAVARVFGFWGLTAEDSATLVGVSARTWARMRAGQVPARLSQDQETRISGLIGLYKGLHLYFDDPLADLWPTRPNSGPLFGGEAPLRLMLDGGIPAILSVRNTVDALRGGL